MSRPEVHNLELYVTGATQNSMAAINNIKRICDQHLAGNYHLEIIDVYQQPTLAESKELIATPTLIKLSPGPVRRFVGDMSDTAAVLNGLDINP